MTQLSWDQVASAAFAAGFRGRALATITAIAGAESSRNPAARCHNCFPGVTEDSRGLTQINVDAHPQYAQADMYDPVQNMHAAYAVSSGGRNFTPWSTYGNGAYLTYWPMAAAAAQRVAGGKAVPVPSTATAPAAAGGGVVHATNAAKVTDIITAPWHAAVSMEHFVADLVNPHTWLRVVYVIGGMALVVMGVYMLDADLTKKAGLFVGGTAGGQLVSKGLGPAAEEAAAVAAV